MQLTIWTEIGPWDYTMPEVHDSAMIIAVLRYSIRKGKPQNKLRHYNVSFRTGAKALLQNVRLPWSNENYCYWMRDVLFVSDAICYRVPDSGNAEQSCDLCHSAGSYLANQQKQCRLLMT